MTIHPKVNIDDEVKIVGCGCIQTEYGINLVHLPSKASDHQSIKYYVHDVRLTVWLKLGEIKYDYLIGDNKGHSSIMGWVDGENIELFSSSN